MYPNNVNLYDFGGSAMIDVKLKVENLGNLLYLDRAFVIDASVSDGYNKVKDKFSKKEGTAEITSATSANVQTHAAS